MASFTVRVGVILVILGVASYVMTGGASLTALIPSVVGGALAVCGVLAGRSTTPRPLALRAALVVAGVGLIGTAGALVQIGRLLAGTGGPALVARTSMALVLLVYVAFAARAFVRDALQASRHRG